MSVTATYEVRIDLDNDLSFESGNEDVSGYVMDAIWTLGCTEPWVPLARAATMELLLKNTDGRFSPEHGSALTGFAPGRLVRIRISYSGTTRQHFIGWIDPQGIQPAVGQYGQRTCIVQASGWMMRIQQESAALAVQESKRVDEVVASLVQASGIYPPGIVGWLAGHPIYGRAGVTTIATSGTDSYLALDAAKTTLNYAGDNWGDGVSVYGAMRDLTNAEGEGAMLYVDRDGKLTFRHRLWMAEDYANASDGAFTDAYLIIRGQQDYGYGNIINDVTIRFNPRSVASSPSTLGSLESAVKVAAGDNATRTVRYDDGSGNRIGGKDVSVISVVATSARDGGGDDLSGNISTSITSGGTSAEVKFTNSGTVDAYCTCSVQGTAITDYGKQEIHLIDTDSIGSYGRCEAPPQNLRLLDDDRAADRYAQLLISMRKTPTGGFTSVTLAGNKSSTMMGHVLARTIGDRITVSETQTGTSGVYFIVGEQHHVDENRVHTVTWYLRPAPANTYWLAGHATYGKAGLTTRATY